MFAVGLLPLGLAGWRRGLAGPSFGIIGAVAVAVGFSQTGILQRNWLASTDVAHLLSADAHATRCEEMIDALLEVRLLLAPPGPQGLTVSGALWDQLPPPMQDAVLNCAQEVSGTGAGTEPVEVLRR